MIGFPGDASGKEPNCQRRRHKRHGFDPWVGSSAKIFNFVVGNEILKAFFLATSLGLWDLSSLTRD